MHKNNCIFIYIYVNFKKIKRTCRIRIRKMPYAGFHSVLLAKSRINVLCSACENNPRYFYLFSTSQKIIRIKNTIKSILYPRYLASSPTSQCKVSPICSLCQPLRPSSLVDSTASPTCFRLV